MRPCGPIRYPNAPSYTCTYSYHVEIITPDGTVTKTDSIETGYSMDVALDKAREAARNAKVKGSTTKWIVTKYNILNDKESVYAIGGYRPNGRLFRER